MKTLKQWTLYDPISNAWLTTWLDSDLNLSNGDAVTLKDSDDPNRWWMVKHSGGKDITKHQLDKQRKWVDIISYNQ